MSRKTNKDLGSELAELKTNFKELKENFDSLAIKYEI